MDAVFVDLETGGLAPHHPDIQVAAIALRGWEEATVYQAKISFDLAKAEPEALTLNSWDGPTWEREALSEALVVKQLAELFRAHAHIPKVSQRGKAYSVARIVGHNVLGFDGPRLKAMFGRHQAFLPADVYGALDTLQLARWRCALDTGRQPSSYRLEDLCAHFGIAFTDGHDALADVRATIALARALCESR